MTSAYRPTLPCRHRLWCRALLLFMLLLLTAAPASGRHRIGLVLGGGGAKGAAEVGALKVLEQAGVRPDYIVGTSIGSIVGCLYAAGYTTDELERLFTDQEWLSLLTDWRSDLSTTPYRREQSVTYIFGMPFLDLHDGELSLFRGQRVHQMLDSLLALKGCQRFEQLPTPFRCVAARLIQAEEVVLGEGSVADAVRASMAIPVLLKQGVVDGERLVDGGLMNNVPIDVAQDMGADIVIVVDLTQQRPRPQSETSFWQQVGQLGAQALNFFLGSNIGSWVLQRPDTEKYLANLRRLGPDDVYITPRLEGFSTFTFGNENMTAMVRLGQEAAAPWLPRLLRLRVMRLF